MDTCKSKTSQPDVIAVIFESEHANLSTMCNGSYGTYHKSAIVDEVVSVASHPACNQLLSQLWYISTINSATNICLYHTTDSVIAYTGLRACSTEIYLQARSSRQYLVHTHDFVESLSIVWSIFRFILCSSDVIFL